MKLNIPLGKNRPALSPDEITAKADTDAATLSARIKAAEALKKVKAQKPDESIAIRMTRMSSGAIMAGFLAVVVVGYYFDFLFYGQQSDLYYINAGLLLFAFAMRTTAVFVPVVLEWAKPEERASGFRWWWQKPEAKPEAESKDTLDRLADEHDSKLRAIVSKNMAARAMLRFLFILCVLGCSVATLSFFSSGHENRQFEVAGRANIESVTVGSKAARIEELEKRRAQKEADRDKLIDGARASMNLVLDDGQAGNDDVSAYEANIGAYQAAYAAESATIDAEIDAIQMEQETTLMAAAAVRAESAPFLSVYRFLSRAGGSQEQWTVWGAVFFTTLFELLCAFALGAAFVVLKGRNFIIRKMEAKEAENVLRWDIELKRYEADVRLQALKAQALRDRDEMEFTLAQAREQARQLAQRSAAEREIADVETRAKEAKARFDAIAAGETPETYDARKLAEAALKRAETDREIAEIEARTQAAIRATAAARNPAPEGSASDEAAAVRTANARNAGNASADARKAKAQVINIRAGNWITEDPNYSEPDATINGFKGEGANA